LNDPTLVPISHVKKSKRSDDLKRRQIAEREVPSGGDTRIHKFLVFKKSMIVAALGNKTRCANFF
jgi:hypothetical protein